MRHMTAKNTKCDNSDYTSVPIVYDCFEECLSTSRCCLDRSTLADLNMNDDALSADDRLKILELLARADDAASKRDIC